MATRMSNLLRTSLSSSLTLARGLRVLLLLTLSAPAVGAEITARLSRSPVALDDSFQLVFEASGSVLAVAEGWHRGPTIDPIADPTQMGDAVLDLVKRARKNAGMDGQDLDGGVL